MSALRSDPRVPLKYEMRFMKTLDEGQAFERLRFDITPTGMLALPTDSYNPAIPCGPLRTNHQARFMDICVNRMMNETATPPFDKFWGESPTAVFIERIIDGYRHLNQFNAFGICIWEE